MCEVVIGMRGGSLEFAHLLSIPQSNCAIESAVPLQLHVPI